MDAIRDLAAEATELQKALTEAEHQLVTTAGSLPAWYLTLRERVHEVIDTACGMVGFDAENLMDFWCDEETHQETCLAFRAAAGDDSSD